MADSKTIVSMDAYKTLLRRDMKLTALEGAGVDNWEGYDDAMEMSREMAGEDEWKVPEQPRVVHRGTGDAYSTVGTAVNTTNVLLQEMVVYTDGEQVFVMEREEFERTFETAV